MRFKGECGGTPQVGKSGDVKPSRIMGSGRGLGRGLGRRSQKR